MEDDFFTTDSNYRRFYMPIANDTVITDGQLPSEFTVGGWVYVMSNVSMPDIYKIGMTTSTPERRANELYSSSGVPTKFKVELAFYSWSPREDEGAVHQILSGFRVNESREFFKAPLGKIKWACREVGLEYRENNLAEIAVLNDIICTGHIKHLDIDEIFDEESICYFGDKNAVADMLLRVAARLIRTAKGYSFYINDGEISLIEPVDEQYLRTACGNERPDIPNFIKELINGQSKKY